MSPQRTQRAQRKRQFFVPFAFSVAKTVSVTPHLARSHLIGAALATLLGMFGLWLKGPTPIIRGMTPQDTAVPVAYMVAAFPFFGILLADWWGLTVQRRWRATTILGLRLLLLAVLSVARLGLLIPISGHVLLVVFFILWTAGQGPHRVRRLEWWLAWVALLVFVAIKLLAWADWLSPLTGAVVGLLLYLTPMRLTPAQPDHRDDANHHDDQRDTQPNP